VQGEIKCSFFLINDENENDEDDDGGEGTLTEGNESSWNESS